MKKYIKVPFAEKDAVKQLGARWDTDMKSWYIPDDSDESSFSKWERHDPSVKVESNATRIYLNVPFEEKDQARSAGARWDGDKKQWYYLSDQDSNAFGKWFSSDQSGGTAPAKIGNKIPQNNKPAQNQNSGNDDLSDLDAILSLGDD